MSQSSGPGLLLHICDASESSIKCFKTGQYQHVGKVHASYRAPRAGKTDICMIVQAPSPTASCTSCADESDLSKERQAHAYLQLGNSKRRVLFYSWHPVWVANQKTKLNDMVVQLEKILDFEDADTIIVLSIDVNLWDKERLFVMRYLILQQAYIIPASLRKRIVHCLHCMCRQQ